MSETMGSEEQDRLDPLHPRELEILSLMSKGLSNNEIALKLSLSVETVKWYNKHIFSKLGVSSRSQAVAKAAEAGILASQAPAPARQEPRPVHNLPSPITSFVGREKEIQEVRQLVFTSRLVTITGAGGVGKTRLAIQVAATLNPQYTDGVRWVSFAARNDTSPSKKPERMQTTEGQILPTSQETSAARAAGEDVVIQVVARALRVPESLDLPLMQGVLEHLRDKHLLLILDNCEHLIDACAFLAERMLTNCPRVTLLVTSREALSVPGEMAWRLPSLTLPPVTPLPGETRLPQAASLLQAPIRVAEHASTNASIFQSEAFRLFIQRVVDVVPGYKPTEAEIPIIAQICQSLDGIPLAIELAAARMNLLSVQEIASRLDHRFSLLTGGHRTALPRHQTLHAAIEWSYDLLSETEQMLFRRLAIFAGSFTMAAAEAICTSQKLPSEEVLTLLGRLVDKSLLMVEPSPADTGLPTRYRFLDTIRSFARLKLDEAGETYQLHEHHAGYYVHLVEATEAKFLYQYQVHFYRFLQAENDNLRVAIEWSVENDQAEIALRLTGGLIWFWAIYSSPREGRDLSLKALRTPSAALFPQARAKAYNTAAHLQIMLGDTPSARHSLDAAQSILRESNNEENLAWSMQSLAMLYTYEGKYDLADAALEEGMAIAKKLAGVQINSLPWFLGDIELRRGDRSRAKKLYEENIRFQQALGNKLFLAYPLRRLGYMALEQNDISTAGKYFHESLALNHETSDMPGTTASLASFAALAIQLGKPEAAARLYGTVDKRLETLSTNVFYLDQAELATVRTKLLATLELAAFAAAYAEGWEMSEEQAIALAGEIYKVE